MEKQSHMRFGRSASFVIASAFFALMGGCSPEYPSCDTDEDCKSGEYCVNNLCQQCRSDADCPTGQSCNAGACEMIDGYCGSDSECGSGEECQNNRCVAMSQSRVPEPIEPPDQSCSLQSVYFDYDSSNLEGSARDQLAAIADCIKQKGMSRVHLTGLTDPRGTEEYNLALGDRRAQSATKYLKSLGVSADVSYSSMGEELATGTDEASWARDRRVDVKER